MIDLRQDKIKSILVVNLGGVGNLLLSTPALRSLRKLYPDSRISLLTVRRSLDITRVFAEMVDDVLVLKHSLPFAFSLRKKRFDMVINLRTLAWGLGALKMAILFFAVGAKYKVGRDTQGRGFFLNVKLPEEDNVRMHDVDYNLSLIRMLGGRTENRGISLNILPQAKQYIDELLRENEVASGDILIGINPTATWRSKRWPLENFSEVINGLKAIGSFKFVITGPKEDIPLFNQLKALSKTELINAAGKTDIWQLCALIDRCSLFITNDGGSMHIASILKKPFVAIFGPTDIVRFGAYEPYAQGVILHKKLDCSPCFRKDCASLKCMRSITPREVLDAAVRVLNEVIRKNSQ
jgi:heptosyltransferase-2